MVRNCLPCTRTPQLTDSPFFVRSLSCSVTSPWWRHRTPTMCSSRPAFGTVWMACAAETRPVNTEMLPAGAWWCIYEVIRQHDSCNTGELDRHAQHQQPCLASRTLRVIRVYCPTRATCFIRDTLVFVRAPSDVSSFVLKAISNENRELSHTTPEAAKSTPEAATLATLILPINRRVTRVV